MAISFPPFHNLRSRNATEKGQHLRGEQSTSRSRLLAVWGILMVGGMGLALNLVRLQIIQAPTLRQRAQNQQVTALQPFVPRRPIIDRQGNVVAIDEPAHTLYAHPFLFKQSQQAIASQLAPILNRSEQELLQLFSSDDSGIRVEYALNEETADRIANLGLDGLELERQQQRFYPQQDLFATVVGYVNTERQGQAGLEYSQQSILERSIEPVQISRAGDGAIIPDDLPGSFLRQDDLQLQITLDSRLQRASRLALEQQMQQFSAKRGAVMVMDVRTGEILSMVTEPSYDPNQYYRFDMDLFRTWVLTDSYEPGSTFKPINVAIALESGTVSPNDVFYDEGWIEVDSWPIQNADYNERGGGRGSVSVQEIVQYSSNVGMVHIMESLDPADYYGWLEKIGLGQPTGIDLPFESQGQIKSLEQFVGSPVEPATTAFGHGFSLTAIQLLQLHGALANQGEMVVPHVVRGLYNSEGQAYWRSKLPAPRRIFSPQTAQTVLGMMEAAVQDGTGESAQILGYRIAGKTGTAQKVSSDGGYHDYARITSFVSILPAESPRYVVLVVIDEPQGEDAYGSTVAAPIARGVMEALIAIEGIPPSQPQVVEEPPIE
ncbi:MAG: penicillin-binding protein 2 [Leptolyngbyaceae cyanobacterium SM1_4_3]|nr:penicillin-binding protein 2 [Leptolyngbyaceae cyanobacterium SM1_4_3]